MISHTVDTGRIEVYSNDEKVVDLPVDITYASLPQHVFSDQVITTVTKPLVIPPELSFEDLLIRTLHLLSVGSKRFFVNRFDRSITGLIASQPVRLLSRDYI